MSKQYRITIEGIGEQGIKEIDSVYIVDGDCFTLLVGENVPYAPGDEMMTLQTAFCGHECDVINSFLGFLRSMPEDFKDGLKHALLLEKIGFARMRKADKAEREGAATSQENSVLGDYLAKIVDGRA